MLKDNHRGILQNVTAVRPWLILLVIFCLASHIKAAENKILPGHVPAVVAHLPATGGLPATNRLTLAIGLPLRNTNELAALLNRLTDPKSPAYRHYLTSAQFTERFGPTLADYAAVKAFAAQNHLTVCAEKDSRLLLDVSGSVADIQRAFNVTLKVYHHPTQARDFYSPDTEPSIATNLPIADIGGLNNYSLPHPQSLKFELASGVKAAPHTGSGANGTYMGNDFRAAYLPEVTLTGAGQTVGLLEFDGYYAADIAAYETAAGLPAVPLQNVSVDGAANTIASTDGNVEVSLDIEMAVAMAPGLAKIVVFEAGSSGNQNDILNAMAAETNISQFSSSWGWGGGPNITTDSIFKKMIAQGQSYFNASGDSDAFTVGASSVNGVDNPSNAGSPSSSPYVTEVGGTTLTTTGGGGSWSAETVWNWGDYKGSYVGTSGGISSYYAIPSWQASVSMSANGGSASLRNIPDVALTADNIYVTYGNGSHTSVGGTSCAAPLWAALTALMNEQAETAGRPPLGFLNPAIYALGASSSYPTSFHDTATGNNEWPSSPSGYSAVTGYDLCTGWGTPAGQSLIDALAGPSDSLHISFASAFSSSGYVGGPFTTNAESFTLSNAGTNTLPWSVGSLPSWLTATPATGTLSPSATATVILSLNSTVSALPAGSYSTSIAFTNLTTGNAQGFLMKLQILPSLAIQPTNGFSARGYVGGPFNTNSETFTLVNEGASPLAWTTGGTPEWLTVTPASGTIAAYGNAVVTVMLNNAAAALPGGVYTNTFSFINTADQTSQSRTVILAAGQNIVQNGGFETGTFTGWTLVGNTVISGNVYNAIESASSTFSSVVHSGSYGAFLGDTSLATVSQNLPTVPGQNYRLSFWLDNPVAGTGQQFRVNWITNAATASQIYYIINPAAFTWSNFTYLVTATTTNTELQFAAENAPNYFGFDDITLTPIPSPSVADVTRSGSTVGLTLYTTVGVKYQLLYATNLAQTPWISLGTNTATATTLTLTNNPGTDRQRFYRVQLVSP